MSNNPNEMYETLQALPKNSAATQEQSEKFFRRNFLPKIGHLGANKTENGIPASCR